MKKMRRIVALIAMLAVLMSSFVFAEEAIVEEIAEPVAAAEELLMEAAEAEAPATEEIEEEAAQEEEAAPAAEAAAEEQIAVAAVTSADACDHIVVCSNPGYCVLCKQAVTGVEPQHPGNITDSDPLLCPSDPGKHGYYCEECNSFVYLEEHITDCTAENPNICDICHGQVDDEYLFHSGLEKDYRVVESNTAFHGIYCTACKSYLNVAEHSVSCISADTTRCDACKTKVDASDIKHNYVNDVCTLCGASLGIEVMTVVEPGALGVGEKYALQVSVEPAGAAYTLAFKSGSTSVAAIDADGVITAKKAGSAKIGVQATGADGKTITGTVTVTVKKAPTKVAITPSKLSLYIGDEGLLTPNIGGSKFASTLKWVSSDPSIVFVDSNGGVVATGIGEATITVTTFNGKSASAKVKVTELPSDIVVPFEEVNMYSKQKLDLGATLVDKYGNECEGAIDYESDSPKQVSVSASGVVTVKTSGTGSATITLCAGSLKKEVIVNVCAVPSKVTLDETKVELLRGDTYQIEPIIGEDRATVFTYKSSKSSVASVDKNGLLTAKGEGTATITITTHNKKSVKLTVKVEDPYKPEKVELSESGTYYLSLGEELQLEATLYPETAESELLWNSTKKQFATVDENGLVTAVKEGTTKVAVKTYNGLTDSVTITVVDPYKVAAVELEESGTVALALDETLELHANILPVTADSDLKWTTSSAKVATVDEFGVVTPVKEGTATITVKSENGKSDTVKVKVYDPSQPYAVELDQSGTLTLNIGEELQLNATVLPDTADTELKWSSSNAKIVAVDQDGAMMPIKTGTVTITVKTENGLKDTVKVKVVDKHKPTSIELAPIGAVTVGDSVEMQYSLEPAGAMSYVQWKSSDKDVATVDARGVVTFVGQGSVTISAKTHNSKTDSLKITVGAAILPDSVTLPENINIGVGESRKLSATLTPGNAKAELSWISSDASVATISADGVLTGKKVGKAWITVTTSNGKTDSVEVTVVSSSTGVEIAVSTDFAELNTILGGMKKIEANGKIYYTDSTGSGAVKINSGSKDVQDSVQSIELTGKSIYRVCGVGVGMSAEEAAAALQKNGATVDYTDDYVIMAVSGSFGIEIALSDATVTNVFAYAA